MAGVPGMKSAKRRDLPKWSNEFLSQIDGRSELGVALRKRREQLEWDVSGGDPDLLSYAQRSLIARALWLEVRLEHDESKLAFGEPVSAGSHTTLINCLNGLYRTLGIARKMKRMPSLREYVQQEKAK